MIYAKVGIMRDAGLEARWGKLRSGAPAMFVRNPKEKSKTWWLFDKSMQKLMTKHGVIEGYKSVTAISDIFSITV